MLVRSSQQFASAVRAARVAVDSAKVKAVNSPFALVDNGVGQFACNFDIAGIYEYRIVCVRENCCPKLLRPSLHQVISPRKVALNSLGAVIQKSFKFLLAEGHARSPGEWSLSSAGSLPPVGLGGKHITRSQDDYKVG